MRDIKSEITEALAKIEETENVRVLYAVESGSRAWGVESPDSDYDVRFVYVRPMQDYLSILAKRDVIEWQLDDVLDINGWDLKKTLSQFHRGNATLFEWANAPIIYKTTDAWREIYETCKPYFSAKAALHHYCGTANSTYQNYLQGETVKYKKYIYALRPILACRYIENTHAIPPVRFADLLGQNLPEDLSEAIEKMLAIKAVTEEKDMNPKIPAIQDYIQAEIARYGQIAKKLPDDRKTDWESLDAVFVKILGGLQYGYKDGIPRK